MIILTTNLWWEETIISFLLEEGKLVVYKGHIELRQRRKINTKKEKLPLL